MTFVRRMKLQHDSFLLCWRGLHELYPKVVKKDVAMTDQRFLGLKTLA
jgi:hypothetical protein